MGVSFFGVFEYSVYPKYTIEGGPSIYI